MILVDLQQITISNLMMQPGFHQSGIDENLLRHMILNALRSWRVKFNQKYGELVLCCESKRNWRRDVFPLYKENRRKFREKETKIDWNSIFTFFHKVQGELKTFFPYPIVQVDGAEADDVIAVLAKKFHEENSDFGSSNQRTLILSKDGDFEQLQKFDTIDQYDPMGKKFIKCDNPIKSLVEHIVEGCKGDGVPNLFSDDDCITNEDKRQTTLTKKRRQEGIQLVENAIKTGDFRNPNINRNRNMICFDCIPSNIGDEIVKEYEKELAHKKTLGRMHLYDFFFKNDMLILMNHIQEF